MYIAKCLALHASGTLTCTNTRAITNDIITTIAVQYSCGLLCAMARPSCGSDDHKMAVPSPVGDVKNCVPN